MNAGLYGWALILAAVAGISLAAGHFTARGRNLAVVALVLFTVAGVLALVGALDAA